MNEKSGTAGRVSHRMVANIAYVTSEARRLESQICRKVVYVCMRMHPKAWRSLGSGKIEGLVSSRFHRQIAGTGSGVIQG